MNSFIFYFYNTLLFKMCYCTDSFFYIVKTCLVYTEIVTFPQYFINDVYFVSVESVVQ